MLLRTSRRTSVRQLLRTPGGTTLGRSCRGCYPAADEEKRSTLLPTPQAEVERIAAKVAGGTVWQPAPDELLLIGRRHQRDNNSWLHNSARLTRGRPRHQLLIHPDDARDRSIEDGALVTVTSEAGKVEIDVAFSADMMPGVVSLPHGYGHGGPGVRLGVATRLPGVSVNDLTDPDRVESLAANAVLHGVPVRVAPAGGTGATGGRPD